MNKGIYILANDIVFDQLVALLNSIEINHGKDIPICILPYDDRIKKVKEEIKNRGKVFIYEDEKCIKDWEEFSLKAWEAHPTALDEWQKKGDIERGKIRRLGMNRRYCAFDPRAPFKKFIYLDADILIFNKLDYIFNELNRHEVVVNDFQHKDLSHIYNTNSKKLEKLFEGKLSQIFCAGFYGGKSGLIGEFERENTLNILNDGNGDILYPNAPNQSLLNFLLMSNSKDIFNITLHYPKEKVTGNCVVSTHFKDKNHILYDHDKRLTYLHYMGYGGEKFERLCKGHRETIPYKKQFIYYRFLKQPKITNWILKWFQKT